MNIPAVNKSKVAIGFLLFLILGLVLLLVRENEGKVSAETKLNDMKYRMESTASEKDSLINELKNTIHDLETKIADLTAKHEADMTEKASEIQGLHGNLDEASKKYDSMVGEKAAEMTDLEAKSKAQADRMNGLVKEKSAKIGELGGELEKASARYAVLLKEKESVEARAISAEADIASLKSDLKKVEREKERLNAAIQALTKKAEPAHD